jgi:hypothetical protein
MPASARLGVVTVTYNSGKVIEAFMRCVLAQEHADFELVIIDNASSDNTPELLARGRDKRAAVVPNSSNLGVAAGNNQGIRLALASGCTQVLLINNDVEFDAHLFGSLLAAAGRLDADMLVPKIYFWDQPNKLWYAGGRFCWPRPYPSAHRGHNQIDRGQFDRTEKVDYGPTCCMLIRASVFKRIGFMDESYFVYCDDTDFCYRARKASLSLYYEPRITLLHKASSLTAAEPEFARRFITRNTVYFIRKTYGRPESLARLLVLQAYFLEHFLRRLLLHRDGWQELNQRQRWFREGFVMPLPRPAVSQAAAQTRDRRGT